MSTHSRPHSRQMSLWLRAAFSMLALAAILFLGGYALRFCLGLFVNNGDYIVSLPGQPSPVVQQAAKPGDGQASTTPGFIQETSRATITVAGDLMMHMPITDSGKTEDGYNYESIFAYIKDDIAQADYAAVNLETTLAGTEDGRKYTGSPKFNSPDAIAAGAKAAGFDLLLTGNNHCNDTGTYGLKRTLEVLKAQQLDTLGTAATAEEAKYVVKDINGIRVGMICYTFAKIGDNREQPVINDLPTDTSAAGLINAFDYKKLDMFYGEMATHIEGMRQAGAEAIVLFIHWGDSLTGAVNADQTAIAQKMCDLGVDVIAGSHSHVVQPVALLHGTENPSHQTLCIYSLGNFLSNQRADNISLTTGQSEDGVLFSFTLVKFSDGTVMLNDADMLPTWILVRGSGANRKYQVLPLDKDVEDWKTVFDLSDSQAQAAENSYNRTTAALADSFQQAQTEVREARKAWDDALADIQGVG